MSNNHNKKTPLKIKKGANNYRKIHFPDNKQTILDNQISFFKNNEQNFILDSTINSNTNSNMPNSTERLNHKVDELEKRIKKTESNTPTVDLSSIENDIDDLQTATTTNANSLATLQSAVSQNQNDISTLSTSIATNTNNIATNTNDITNLQNTVNGFSNSISNNTSNIATNTSNINSLQNTVSGYNSILTNLQQNVNSYDNRITTNANNISNLQTTVSGYNTTINSLQSTVNGFSGSINTNTNNITTNTNNISSLTTSVNSCIQAINEINNGAELPSPLFTIDGVSFGTPVYSVYDDFVFEHHTLLRNATYNRSIWFICEPYSILHFKVFLKLQLPNSSTTRKIIYTINDTIIKEITLSNTTEELKDFYAEFNYYPNKRNNNLRIYITSNSTKDVHICSKYQIYGKNVLILNNKRAIHLVPNVNNNYLFSRTVEGYGQYQLATYENLDFENGWQYVPNYQNYFGAKHHYILGYTKNANNEYVQTAEYLVYQEHGLNEQRLYIFYDIANGNRIMSSNVEPVNSVSIQLFRDYSPNLCITFDNMHTNRTVIIYDTIRGYGQSFLSSNYFNYSNVYATANFVVDTAVAQYLTCAFDLETPIICAQVTNIGAVFLYSSFRSLPLTTYVGIGSQPFLVCEGDGTTYTIYLYLNQYGTISKYTYTLTRNKGFIFESKEVVDYGEYIIGGYNNDYFLQLNGKIYKKQKND